MILIDTNILIDYFEGKLPKKYFYLLEHTNISCITLAELADKFERNNKDFDEVKDFIENTFTIQDITLTIARKAAKLKKEIRKQNPKFGLSDAIILATAKENKLELYTKDNDFKNYANILRY